MSTPETFWVAEMFLGSNPVVPATYWTGRPATGSYTNSYVTGDIHKAQRFESKRACKDRLRGEEPLIRDGFMPTEHEVVP